MKRTVVAQILALATCIVSSIYACKTERAVNKEISTGIYDKIHYHSYTVIDKLHNYYLSGFMWILVVSILIVVALLLLGSLILQAYVSSKKRELRQVINEQ